MAAVAVAMVEEWMEVRKYSKGVTAEVMMVKEGQWEEWWVK
mgnify:CR=1 FL=1